MLFEENSNVTPQLRAVVDTAVQLLEKLAEGHSAEFVQKDLRAALVDFDENLAGLLPEEQDLLYGKGPDDSFGFDVSEIIANQKPDVDTHVNNALLRLRAAVEALVDVYEKPAHAIKVQVVDETEDSLYSWELDLTEQPAEGEPSLEPTPVSTE